MHTLSVFPQMFFLGLVAPFLLRITVGLFLIYLGKNRYKKTYTWSSIFYIISGILLFVGIYTQFIAIVSILILIFDFYLEQKKSGLSDEKKILYIMSAVILLSLLFTGAGFLAFDRPL